MTAPRFTALTAKRSKRTRGAVVLAGRLSERATLTVTVERKRDSRFVKVGRAVRRCARGAGAGP